MRVRRPGAETPPGVGAAAGRRVPGARAPPTAGPASGRRGAYADTGRCTRIDCSRPTATQAANIDEPP